MSWIVEDRRNKRLASDQPLVTDEMRRHVTDVLMPRYPTRRACLLPALHLVQHEYGWIPPQAMAEVGDLLEIAPAEVLDTATFYEEYWLRKKGKYLVQVCRSLACEVCGSDEITRGLCDKLGIDVGETTDDERFTLVELECLGSCGTAPVAMVNDVLHEDASLQSVSRIIDALPDDPHHYGDPTIDFEVPHGTPRHGMHDGDSNNIPTSGGAKQDGGAAGSAKIAATGEIGGASQKPAVAPESSPSAEPAKTGTARPGSSTPRKRKATQRGGKSKSGKKKPGSGA